MMVAFNLGKNGTIIFSILKQTLLWRADMKTIILKNVLLLAVIGLCGQFALAQSNPNQVAIQEIADIVANLNHFPSDDDKAKLAEISGNNSLAQGVRTMADSVANINHSASAEAKTALQAMANAEQIPPYAKTLANIIANINHTASADDKAKLASLFE